MGHLRHMLVQKMEGEGERSMAKQCISPARHRWFTAGAKVDDGTGDSGGRLI
jgi:hypothetical protein